MSYPALERLADDRSDLSLYSLEQLSDLFAPA